MCTLAQKHLQKNTYIHIYTIFKYVLCRGCVSLRKSTMQSSAHFKCVCIIAVGTKQQRISMLVVFFLHNSKFSSCHLHCVKISWQTDQCNGPKSLTINRVTLTCIKVQLSLLFNAMNEVYTFPTPDDPSVCLASEVSFFIRPSPLAKSSLSMVKWLKVLFVWIILLSCISSSL